MKKFLGEFKKFITRGNVMDMAVGVIIGSAFTAIVNALTKNILQPVINWIIYVISGSNNSLEGVYTILVGSADDLANAIYIDWGMLISSIINFFLIALVLFIILKTFNKIKESNDKLMSDLTKGFLPKEIKKELKANGIKLSDKERVKAFLEEKEAAEEQAKKIEDEKKKAEEEEAKKHTPEALLERIVELLEKQEKKEGQ